MTTNDWLIADPEQIRHFLQRMVTTNARRHYHDAVRLTEKEWLECCDLARLLESLPKQASKRKLGLFVAACCRRLWHKLSKNCGHFAIELIEYNAEGHAYPTPHAGSMTAVREAATHSLDYSIRLAMKSVCHAANHEAIECADAVAQVAELDGPNNWDNERDQQLLILRDILGNPFRLETLNPQWQTAEILELARAIHDNRAFDRVPLLGDLLRRVGCDNEAILMHFQNKQQHALGCWALDLVLGKS